VFFHVFRDKTALFTVSLVVYRSKSFTPGRFIVPSPSFKIDGQNCRSPRRYSFSVQYFKEHLFLWFRAFRADLHFSKVYLKKIK